MKGLLKSITQLHTNLSKIICIFGMSLLFFVGSSAAQAQSNTQANATAVFAGGCFWCMEPPFEKLDGVSAAISGYIGGNKANANYKQVSQGSTQHYEAVEIHYNPSKVSYVELVEVFWKQIDPTDEGGSFVDRGPQYRSGIFYKTEKEKQVAELSKVNLQNSELFAKDIVTEILPAGEFFKAEDYHQDYYLKNPLRYNYYRSRSGRDQFIKANWSKPNKANTSKMTSSKEKRLKELTPLQFRVTQEEGTERPFSNEYWDNTREGIYVDIVSGEALFSSTHKFKSGTGWPSFYETLGKENIVQKKDTKLFISRVEVRSKQADSHLGHLFEDGPAPTGLRYCINSAALEFIAVEDLKVKGYGQYLHLFNK